MIDLEKYRLILDEGLMLDHYLLLVNIKNGKELLSGKRTMGFINLLCKKGYLEDGYILTDKASKLIESEGTPLLRVPPKTLTEILSKGKDVKFDYADWVIQLHKKCEDKLVAGIGKKQIRTDIKGTLYSFLPNSTDLGKVVLRVSKAYKLKDFNKIEETILKYIDRCIRTNKWTPLLGYYIMKEDKSFMVTDMSSDEEEATGDNPSIHIV